MPDVALRLILIVHLIQNQLVLNPTGLYECLIVHTKNVGFFQTCLSGWKISYKFVYFMTVNKRIND